MRVLACGSRDWADDALIQQVLSDMAPSLVIHGGARGADRLAGQAADRLGVPTRIFLADWNRYGRQAGFLRNQQMLEEGQPDVVVAFTLGTPGTADMMHRTQLAGIPLLVYGPEEEIR